RARPRSPAPPGPYRLGRDDVQDDVALPRSLVCDLVGSEDLVGRGRGARLVARVDLGKRVSGRERVAMLLETEDADGVVDLVVLIAAPRTKVQSGVADLNGPE